MSKLTRGQLIALRSTVDEFDENESFDDILNKVYARDESIKVWCGLEILDDEVLIEFIENLSEYIDDEFTTKH